MAETAAFCVDYVFPQVPVRQYVLTVPYCHLRFQMAYSPTLASAVLRAFIATITSDLRRRARKRKIRGELRTGSMTAVSTAQEGVHRILKHLGMAKIRVTQIDPCSNI